MQALCPVCGKESESYNRLNDHMSVVHREKVFECPRQKESSVFPPYPEHISFFRSDNTCSFCGSMGEEEFFLAVEAGQQIVPTDKSYKVYVGGSGRGKFYFQHLSEAGRQRFVHLLNNGTMKLGFPGHFYVAPFFVKFGPKV